MNNNLSGSKDVWMIWRLVALAASIALFASACSDEPRDGQLTFINASDHDVLFLIGGPNDTLEERISPERLRNPETLAPTGLAVISFDLSPRPGDDEPWCEPHQYWVLRSRSGRFYNPAPRVQDPPVEIDDLEVLEHRGPGYCWPGRIVSWEFTGE